MGKKGSSTTNVQRPQSAQELALLTTQNEQLKKGIAIAEQQDARSAEQYKYWKENYLPVEGGSYAGNSGSRRDVNAMKKLDNQMPMYAEDTSGARSQEEPTMVPQGTLANRLAKGGR